MFENYLNWQKNNMFHLQLTWIVWQQQFKSIGELKIYSKILLKGLVLVKWIWMNEKHNSKYSKICVDIAKILIQSTFQDNNEK